MAKENDGPFPFNLDKDGPFPLEMVQKYPQAIYSVEHVHIKVVALNGPVFALITAFGTTITSGWRNPRLQPFIYIQPPPDGVWQFVFVAEPPEGVALEVLTPISASYTFPMKGVDFRGVKVHSATNTVIETLRDAAPLKIKSEAKLGIKAADLIR